MKDHYSAEHTTDHFVCWIPKRGEEGNPSPSLCGTIEKRKDALYRHITRHHKMVLITPKESKQLRDRAVVRFAEGEYFPRRAFYGPDGHRNNPEQCRELIRQSMGPNRVVLYESQAVVKGKTEVIAHSALPNFVPEYVTNGQNPVKPAKRRTKEQQSLSATTSADHDDGSHAGPVLAAPLAAHGDRSSTQPQSLGAKTSAEHHDDDSPIMDITPLAAPGGRFSTQQDPSNPFGLPGTKLTESDAEQIIRLREEMREEKGLAWKDTKTQWEELAVRYSRGRQTDHIGHAIAVRVYRLAMGRRNAAALATQAGAPVQRLPGIQGTAGSVVKAPVVADSQTVAEPRVLAAATVTAVLEADDNIESESDGGGEACTAGLDDLEAAALLEDNDVDREKLDDSDAARSAPAPPASPSQAMAFPNTLPRSEGDIAADGTRGRVSTPPRYKKYIAPSEQETPSTMSDIESPYNLSPQQSAALNKLAAGGGDKRNHLHSNKRKRDAHDVPSARVDDPQPLHFRRAIISAGIPQDPGQNLDKLGEGEVIKGGIMVPGEYIHPVFRVSRSYYEDRMAEMERFREAKRARSGRRASQTGVSL